MRRLLTIVLASATVLSASAQKQDKPATAWKTGGMLSVTGGQSGNRNWAPAGSEKYSLTAAINLDLWASKTWGKNTWTNNLDAAYALINTSSQGIRKVNDKLDFFSKYSYSLKGPWALGTIGGLRTQFTNGYDYTETERKRVSGFFAPAYLNFSPIGLQYKTKNNTFSAHFGPALRWVIVTNEPYSLENEGGVKPDGTREKTLAEMYGVDPVRKVKFEVGTYFNAMFKKEILKNVTWKTRLDVNMDYVESKEPFDDVDVYWTNSVGMKVNKWLTVTYNLDLYSDNDVRMFGPERQFARTQLQSLLGVGLGVKF
jgi:hypothetical protein